MNDFNEMLYNALKDKFDEYFHDLSRKNANADIISEYHNTVSEIIDSAKILMTLLLRSNIDMHTYETYFLGIQNAYFASVQKINKK